MEVEHERVERWDEVQWHWVGPRLIGLWGWRPKIPGFLSLGRPFLTCADHSRFGTVWPDGYGINCTYSRLHVSRDAHSGMLIWRAAFPFIYDFHLLGHHVHGTTQPTLFHFDWIFQTSLDPSSSSSESRVKSHVQQLRHIGSRHMLWRACRRCGSCLKERSRNPAASYDARFDGCRKPSGPEYRLLDGERGLMMPWQLTE